MACLRSLYERLHGSGADYSQNLTRDDLRDILLPVVQSLANEVSADVVSVDDELASIETGDGLRVEQRLVPQPVA